MNIEKNLERLVYCLILGMICIFFAGLCVGLLGLIISSMWGAIR
ncbi:hypothetical protein AH02_19 [Pseudomonas phage AH02]|nr:hypothetical protein AH02_19 [Pseudomonas phage AH02]